MKTLFTIGKFVLPVIFVCAMGYFLLPMTNSGSPEAPIVERESAQPLVKESIEKTQSNESSDVSKNGSSRIQKKKPATISKSSVEEKAKIDDPFENVSSALELGQMLFWDPILSGNRDVSCATCHHPDFAYADSRDLSIGTLGVGLGPDRMQTTVPPVRRNAHTIVNTAFNGLNNGRGRGRGQNRDDVSNNSTPVFQNVNQERAPMFWDSRVRSLELQALEPIKAYDEMRGDAFTKDDALDSVVARIKGISDYIKLFKKAYGDEVIINASLIGSSIAEFERSLVAVNSPFDKYRAGDKEALSSEQLRGLQAFRDVGCDNCHRGAMFSDYQLHALGVKENTQLDTADNGAGRFRFRTPSLRNVALTAPYMHNGTFKTLEEVVQFYNTGRSENPNVVAVDGGRRGGNRGIFGFFGGDGQAQQQGANDNNLATLDNRFRRVDDMSASQMSDIVAFLKALTDENFDRTIPTMVPSGLQPGGMIAQRIGRSMETP